MEEPRRIGLTPVASDPKKAKKEKPQSTMRFTLNLIESNNETCPEYSYAELMQNANDEKNDPFAQNDRKEEDKLHALAKKFEEKYATQGKKKSGRVEDLVDLGEGYDDEDSFVDNSEAYDEIVPHCLTTKHGGFYINSGTLDFRQVSDEDEDGKINMVKKKKKKRILSDSEDGEIAPEKKKKSKKKKLLDGDGVEKKKKKKLVHVDGDLRLKKKKLDKSNLLKASKSPITLDVLKEHNMATSTPINNSNNAVAITGESPNVSSLKNDTLTQKNLFSIDQAISSVVNKSVVSPEDSTSQSVTPESAAKLPENLPPLLDTAIAKIKQMAKETDQIKSKFFTPEVNKVLLEIENQSKEVSVGFRSTIYAHLAAFLPCGKETLIKRAKRLRQTMQDDVLREPIQRLKEAIGQAMPAQLERYNAECQIKLNEEKVEKKEEANTESDEDDEKKDAEGGKKKTMGPRKRFDWNDKIRTMLCKVVVLKMEYFEASRVKGQTAEEYLKAFLDAEIRPIWPKGWMQTRTLYKESRFVHQKWTSNVAKPKKITISGKPAIISTNNTNHTQNHSQMNLSDISNTTQNSIHKTEKSYISTPLSSGKNENASKTLFEKLMTNEEQEASKALLDFAESPRQMATSNNVENKPVTSLQQGNLNISSIKVDNKAETRIPVIDLSGSPGEPTNTKSGYRPIVETQKDKVKSMTPSMTPTSNFISSYSEFLNQGKYVGSDLGSSAKLTSMLNDGVEKSGLPKHNVTPKNVSFVKTLAKSDAISNTSANNLQNSKAANANQHQQHLIGTTAKHGLQSVPTSGNLSAPQKQKTSPAGSYPGLSKQNAGNHKAFRNSAGTIDPQRQLNLSQGGLQNAVFATSTNSMSSHATSNQSGHSSQYKTAGKIQLVQHSKNSANVVKSSQSSDSQKSKTVTVSSNQASKTDIKNAPRVIVTADNSNVLQNMSPEVARAMTEAIKSQIQATTNYSATQAQQIAQSQLATLMTQTKQQYQQKQQVAKASSYASKPKSSPSIASSSSAFVSPQGKTPGSSIYMTSSPHGSSSVAVTTGTISPGNVYLTHTPAGYQKFKLSDTPHRSTVSPKVSHSTLSTAMQQASIRSISSASIQPDVSVYNQTTSSLSHASPNLLQHQSPQSLFPNILGSLPNHALPPTVIPYNQQYADPNKSPRPYINK